ncbi:MAG TPA: hypothetical protein P5022_10200 [Candidatus Paceibacterota bacterium]|nr:hypothetical protein [Verrucomicrobiota bacterium]HRZ93267.1 hypothetical protein [Candidatus Paceibacterota bacterium]
MTVRQSAALRILTAAGALALCILACRSLAEPPRWPFFALCMDTHDARKRSLSEQAGLLKELGYNGAGHLWLDQVAERLHTLDAVGLDLFQIQQLGYRGPIGLQCYGIPGDAREHLARSMGAWHQLNRRLARMP